MNAEVNKLAEKIYKNHKDLFDFVFDNKPDLASELYSIFERKIKASNWVVVCSKQKSYVRFLTNKLVPIIPHKGRDYYSVKESFLFEINFWWSKKAIFKTIILQSDTVIQEIFCKAMENIPEFKNPKDGKSLVYYQHNWEFEAQKLTEVDETGVLKLLDAEWPKITEIVNKVETELLKYKDELEKHCS